MQISAKAHFQHRGMFHWCAATRKSDPSVSIKRALSAASGDMWVSPMEIACGFVGRRQRGCLQICLDALFEANSVVASQWRTCHRGDK